MGHRWLRRTTTGGNVWTIMPHSVPISQVNRMDALGLPSANVWIADEGGGHWGMIHTLDNGVTWRREFVPYVDPDKQGLHMVSAYSPMVAWCAAPGEGDLFRTVDGGGPGRKSQLWDLSATSTIFALSRPTRFGSSKIIVATTAVKSFMCALWMGNPS